MYYRSCYSRDTNPSGESQTPTRHLDFIVRGSRGDKSQDNYDPSERLLEGLRLFSGQLRVDAGCVDLVSGTSGAFERFSQIKLASPLLPAQPRAPRDSQVARLPT